jgi:hypothetical protein
MIGWLFGIAGVIVSIYFGIKQTPEKSVAWHVDARANLVSIDPTFANQGKLEVFFEGQPTRNVKFFELSFKNTGYVPLQEEDFRSPLALDFGDDAKIFRYFITKKTPDNLPLDVKVEGGKLTFAPSLFNPGDSFTIQLIGAELPDSPKRLGRIVGIVDIPISSIYSEMYISNSLVVNIMWAAIAVLLVLFLSILVISIRLHRKLRRVQIGTNPKANQIP